MQNLVQLQRQQVIDLRDTRIDHRLVSAGIDRDRAFELILETKRI
jgi:hypothetical protein